ncbi:FtsK/SpoIIIE domain-containing protein [Micromonospora sp. DT44]|uniref:FtsK/SpoIIIE domain-containing protein n=1 Tax=Micromonospora sp. DT44 TaxID=3393439 RepID=UPI003CF89825
MRRRWLSRAYLGSWWGRVTEACNLVTVHRVTGAVNVPRIIRIRSHSPSTETVYVRLLLGQTPKQWEEAAEALAVALKAERVGIERVRPQVIALIVQRSEPFTQVIVPPDVPGDADAVSLANVYLGETEHGTDWIAPLIGQHWLVNGGTGSGKNSVTWMALRACAPLIRDGLVRVHVVNPKGTELNALRPVSYRYAETDGDIVEVVQNYWATMQDRKKTLAEQGRRTFELSRETPLDLLVIDELGAVTGYGDRSLTKGVQAVLPLILSQARALGGSVIGALQEPTKDVIPQRDLFSLRVCLRTTSAGHVDMVLGDDMRRRGALADEIPNHPSTAGIGFVVKQRSRTPLRVRAAYCDDSDIRELVRVAGWPHTELTTAGR